MPAPVVGMDLGTTFSLVAAMRDGVAVVLPNSLGELLTPSAVSIEPDGSILVGAAARARATTRPTHTALSFKRDMGTDRKYRLGQRTMTPCELSALVLGSLKSDAEAALGYTVSEAIVTVPAYFGNAQRQATRDAGAIAGLTVERIINEPTAAALAYGLHQRDRELRAVVLDLGGGTFDVTVLEIIEGVVEIQASAGDSRLGGDDFDEALLELCAHRAREEHGFELGDDPGARARLRAAAEMAKRRLSERDSTRIALVDLPDARARKASFELDLAREEAESAWAALLERIRHPIRRALRDAGIAPGDVGEVLLVGGSTRMPCIAQLAAQLFGRLPLRKLPPDEAVALGAAVQAALKTGDQAVDDMVVTDVAPFTLGVASGTKLGRQQVSGLFSPIIERGTVIPVSRVERYSTLGDMQSEVRIEVYQGEHSHCSDNQKLGDYLVTVPSRLAGEESIDVRFTYDLNGILEVEMTVVSTGKKGTLVIERAPGRLSADDIDAARRAMERLKLHPRNALPNATALARADALFVELSGDERARHGAAIGQFRVALDGQDRARIEEARGTLTTLTSALRR